jgi:hypothetical protein
MGLRELNSLIKIFKLNEGNFVCVLKALIFCSLQDPEEEEQLKKLKRKSSKPLEEVKKEKQLRKEKFKAKFAQRKKKTKATKSF